MWGWHGDSTAQFDSNASATVLGKSNLVDNRFSWFWWDLSWDADDGDMSIGVAPRGCSLRLGICQGRKAKTGEIIRDWVLRAWWRLPTVLSSSKSGSRHTNIRVDVLEWRLVLCCQQRNDKSKSRVIIIAFVFNLSISDCFYFLFWSLHSRKESDHVLLVLFDCTPFGLIGFFGFVVFCDFTAPRVYRVWRFASGYGTVRR